MPSVLKTRSGEPQEAFVRAVYAEMLLEKAEKMLSNVPREISIDAVDEPGESVSPSSWNLGCYQESFEKDFIKRDLFHRLSDEAKDVVRIFLTAPSEITEALLDICLPNERGRPRRVCKTKTDKIVWKPERVKAYLRRRRGFSSPRVEQVFEEVHLYLKETVI